MYAFAEVEDIEEIFRPLTVEERDVAYGLIQQASLKLLIAVPNLDTVVLTDSRKEQLATAAVANAVKRVLMNPEGFVSVGYTIDDYREDYKRDASVATGALYIDRADLVGLTKRSGWGTLRMGSAL